MGGHTEPATILFSSRYFLQAQAGQDPDGGFPVYGFAQQALYRCRSQVHSPAFRQCLPFHRLDHRPRFPTANFQDQARRAFHGAALQGKVHAPLETMGRVRMQPELPGPAGNDNRCKKRAFQEHMPGSSADGRIQVAHHAGHGHCTVRIGNHQGRLRQCMGLSIQQGNFLTTGGIAHGYRAV